MDYLKMTDEEFVNEVLRLYENMNLEILELLRVTPNFLKKTENIINNHIVSGPIRIKFHTFIDYYESYKIVYNLRKLMEYPESYSIEEKQKLVNIICELCKYSDWEMKTYPSLKAKKFLPQQDQEKIDFILSYRFYIEKKNYQKKIEFQNKNVIKRVKEILKLYNELSNEFKDDRDMIGFYLSSKLDIKICMLIYNDIINMYFQKVFLNKNNNLLDEISLDEIIELSKINWNDCELRNYYAYCNYIYSSLEEPKELKKINPQDFDKLFNLIDKVKELINKKYEHELIIGYIVNHLKITLDELENFYKPMLKKCMYLYTEKKQDFGRVLDFKDVYILEKIIIETYKDITNRFKRVLEIILGDVKEKEEIIKIIYQTKYLNGIKPYETKKIFHQKIALLESKDRDKIISFLNGYYEYYEEKTKEQELVQKKEENILQYISIVETFLNSEYDKLNDYFENTNTDKNTFYKAIEILKEKQHPIYEQYKEKIENLQSQRFAIIISKANKIINIMKNGIIQENGKVKKFDLLDYYTYTTLSIEDFLKIIKNNVPNSDYAVAVRTLAKYKNDKPITNNMLNQVLNMKNSYVTESDEKGNIISRYDATIEDKKQVMILLQEKNIPLTEATYSMMLRNYVMKNYSNTKKLIK